MDELTSSIGRRRNRTIGLIRRMVECESPSGDGQAVERMAQLVATEVSGIAKVRRPRGQLLVDFTLPGRPKKGRLLALGHMDTVWPVGTLARMPFRQRAGRLWGPGVFDMKSGIAFFIHAIAALRELDIPVRRRVSMLLVTDEETGSRTSRTVTEREALASDAVLVLEPASGLDGKLKTSRKGVGEYTVTAHGRAAHSGIDFASGANAIVELARQIERISTFSNLERGVTVNPGVITGGSGVNVVPDFARVACDIRVSRMRDAAPLDRKFRKLKPVDSRCRLEVEGGLNRPPMERTAAVASLFAKAKELAAEMGVALEESSTGGASDGNFTGALGVPTLDGLGGVGEGAHAANESILIDRIVDRTALLARLVERL